MRRATAASVQQPTRAEESGTAAAASNRGGAARMASVIADGGAGSYRARRGVGAGSWRGPASRQRLLDHRQVYENDQPPHGGPREPAARLDSWDARRGARGFRFAECRELVEAWRLDQVVPALERIERLAAEHGLHSVGYVAYDAAPAFDPALRVAGTDGQLPLLRFAAFARREATAPPDAPPGAAERLELVPSLDAAAFAARVQRVRALIAAGETYQTNLTFRLQGRLDAAETERLYGRLGAAQQAAYCAYLDFGDAAVLSLSPELHFHWADGALEMRPMKGTRPRGRWSEEDDALARELVESEKERAENLMIVDLLRNDVGRIAEWGSVRVPRLFHVERYATVHQMTSTVRARTRPDVGLADVFRALFPSGSVTGAPKVRTSHIIADLECSPRGLYTGAVGYVSPGEALFNVAIRTLVVERATGRVILGVGSGITYDSDAAAEYSECLQKAAFVDAVPREFELVETLRYHPGTGYFLMEDHLARLAASAARFGFAVDAAVVRAALASHVADAEQPLRVRCRVGRDGRARVESTALDGPARALRAALGRATVDSREPLLYHKTTWREPYDRGRAEHPDHDDVLLRNERDELTEFTIGNLVVEDAVGALWTPPLSAGLLPGVFRARLLREGRIRERVLRVEDLRGARAVFLINSVREWCEVSLD
jgi:para-aminobenzoate synthetase / 4-amino-4-deoxychorismate lyase